MCVLWMCALAYNVSAHPRKIKTKFEIFLKNKSSSLLWTSYPSLSWCHLDICGFSVMPIRTQACSVAGLSVWLLGETYICWCGGDLLFIWHLFSTFPLALVPLFFMFVYLYLLFGFILAGFLPIIFSFISLLVYPFAFPIPMDTNLACSTEVCWLQFLKTTSCLLWINRSFLRL